MKAKKRKAATITLLTRIERLLADALVEFSAIEKSVEKNVRDLLVSAEKAVSEAKDYITPSAPPVRRRTAKSRPRSAHATAKRATKAKRIPRVRAA